MYVDVEGEDWMILDSGYVDGGQLIVTTIGTDVRTGFDSAAVEETVGVTQSINDVVQIACDLQIADGNG
ncbi:MAG: hypothetical protein OXQ89_10335 [Rhodospirillaceae bacterium]|nr:hypothetical protein [Rhodospirillaceae bacterium]